MSSAIGSAVRVHDQRYLNPPALLAALADAVLARGGRIVTATTVTGVEDEDGGVAVNSNEPQDGDNRFDAVVLAHGAWLGDLARRFGVRQPVQAGRGYSFTVTGDELPQAPLHFPTQRVACTPLSTPAGRRLRVAGMMEFRAPEAVLDRRRIDAIVDATRPLLSGVNLDERAARSGSAPVRAPPTGSR